MLFIDDFEKVISMMKSIIIEEEAEEVFDRSWLYEYMKSPEKRKAFIHFRYSILGFPVNFY